MSDKSYSFLVLPARDVLALCDRAIGAEDHALFCARAQTLRNLRLLPPPWYRRLFRRPPMTDDELWVEHCDWGEPNDYRRYRHDIEDRLELAKMMRRAACAQPGGDIHITVEDHDQIQRLAKYGTPASESPYRDASKGT